MKVPPFLVRKLYIPYSSEWRNHNALPLDHEEAARLRRLAVALLVFASALVVTAAAMSLIGQQTLRAPPHISPAVHLLCSDGNLVGITDPDPLVSGFPSGNNGTALFGCGLSTGSQVGLLPALTIVKAGTVNATFSLPTGVSIYLVPNNGVLGPLSQAQCASSGILLNSNTAVNIPLGSYSYCESFTDAASLTNITVSWYE